jgi:acyl-CoA synthetase (NDP forming)
MNNSLNPLLKPRSIAVIGASEDVKKYGGFLYRLLLKHGFEGDVYPVNPGRSELLGKKCFAAVNDLPDGVDLAVVAVPRDGVLPAIEECGKKGVRGAIIITSKFSDEGPEGAAIEARVAAAARAAGVRIIGPNCLGVVNPSHKVVLSFSSAFDVPDFVEDPIGIASQSGALLATMIDRARARGIGFTYGVSLGNQADVDLADLVEFFIDDPKVKLICTYLEGIKNADRFVEVAEKARLSGKPWIMVKAGRTEAGARAAFSHTGSLAGSYQALEAFCRRFGISLVEDIDTMLLVASSLLRFPQAKVSSAVILCTSGGAASIAADRLAEANIGLTEFSPSTKAELAKLYSPGQASNPVDSGGRLPGRQLNQTMVETIGAIARDPAENVVLSMITTLTGVGSVTKAIAQASLTEQKPVISVIWPGHQGDDGRAALREARVPHTESLDEAVRAIRCLIDRTRFVDRGGIAGHARRTDLPRLPESDRALSPSESAELLASFGIPLADEAEVEGATAALQAAQRIGYPVVLKGVAADLVHKSEAGAVVLDLKGPGELEAAIKAMSDKLKITRFLVQKMEKGGAELIVGVTRDAQLGPILVVGAGGVLVELLRDVSSSVVPIGLDEARQLLARLKIAKVMSGLRGKPPLDVEAAAEILMKLGSLAHAMRDRLAELDINPLIVRERGKGCVAVDSRVRLERQGVSKNNQKRRPSEE